MNVRRVELSIEELVVEGVDVGDRDRFVAALEHELTRLIAERPPDGPQRPHAPPRPALAASSPEGWGRAVAAQVHASLAPAPPPRRPP